MSQPIMPLPPTFTDRSFRALDGIIAPKRRPRFVRYLQWVARSYGRKIGGAR